MNLGARILFALVLAMVSGTRASALGVQDRPAVANPWGAVGEKALQPHLSPSRVQSKSTAEHVLHVYLFPGASHSSLEGFVRVINRSPEPGRVTIHPTDEAGNRFDAVILSVDAGETVHFNSGDLETGNAGKGLSGGTGAGEGDWRLAFASDLDIEVLSYIRTTDGFLTAMHDVVPREGVVGKVAVFNPGSNRN